jgi:CTP:molybdopterin cytidylyltransferase MocA
MTAARIGIVVLAAGEARRFGSAKLALPVDGMPLVRRAVVAATQASAKVVVVLGAHRELVESHIADLSVECVFNREWSSGMGSSIARGIAGLEEAAPALDAAIIALADQPMIGAAELMQLIAAHARAPTRIIAAQYAGVLGPPCLFPRKYFGELGALLGTRGARALLRRHAGQVTAVPVPAAAIDIDTPADYARATDA